MDLIDVLKVLDSQVQQMPCPACGQTAGWNWRAAEEETSMTCRNCGVKQVAERQPG